MANYFLSIYEPNKLKRFTKIKNILFSVFCSLVFASFICLTFAKTFQEYIIYLLGVGFLVFGSILAVSTKKNRRFYFIIGLLLTFLSAIILWFFRSKIYKTGVPKTEGKIDNFLSLGGLLWNIIMISIYVYILI